MSRWLLGVVIFALAAAPPAAAEELRAAAIELHNLAGEHLPRIGSYSEQALYRYFAQNDRVRFADRTTVSALLLERRDRVVLFPGDPRLASEFGRELGVDFIVTGNILDYASDGSLHRMTVELIVVDVETERAILRKIYEETHVEETEYKKHREILDSIIQTMARDFEVHVAAAEAERARRAEEERLRREEEERIAREQREIDRRAASAAEEAAEAAREAAAAARRSADEAARGADAAEAAEGEAAAARDAIARLGRELRGETKIYVPQKPDGPKPSISTGAWITVRVLEVELLEANWGLGDGDAELQLLVSAAHASGQSGQYRYPADGPIAAAVGQRLKVADSSFSFRVRPEDGEVPVILCGIDSDALPGTFALLVDGALAAVSRGAGAIARAAKGPLAGVGFLGLGISVGGSALARLLQEADVIGEAEIRVNHLGGPMGDGRSHRIASTNGAIRFTYQVLPGRLR